MKKVIITLLVFMEFILYAILLVLLLFGFYTLGFVIPKQLKDISKQLDAVIDLLN